MLVEESMDVHSKIPTTFPMFAIFHNKMFGKPN